MKDLRLILFDSSEEIQLEIKSRIESIGLEVHSIASHDYHFIFDIGCNGEELGRVRIYYNGRNVCTTGEILEAVPSIYFKKLTDILPVLKGDILVFDEFMEFLHLNLKHHVDIISSCEQFTCYEVKCKEISVWMKVFKDEEKTCEYVKGDTDFYDELAYIYEKEMCEV
ncbi:hypothetical protein [Bacillus cereus]|uniref:hypothetical protein n=1 Tax=Bacillus cereus TaxID=1396 RepID=UPI0009782D8D|nr:hypothetical protein [Bacillus cereus]ONH02184.1 hypothetical protein BKK45_01150 [Bacillus cereus]